MAKKVSKAATTKAAKAGKGDAPAGDTQAVGTPGRPAGQGPGPQAQAGQVDPVTRVGAPLRPGDRGYVPGGTVHPVKHPTTPPQGEQGVKHVDPQTAATPGAPKHPRDLDDDATSIADKAVQAQGTLTLQIPASVVMDAQDQAGAARAPARTWRVRVLRGVHHEWGKTYDKDSGWFESTTDLVGRLGTEKFESGDEPAPASTTRQPSQQPQRGVQGNLPAQPLAK
jgi:hypothetical protein